jgi:chemotaxis response regulator CheB
MRGHPDIVAIGASSGGVEALQSLLEALSDLDASFCETSIRQWW